jgi:hypothetical protein
MCGDRTDQSTKPLRASSGARVRVHRGRRRLMPIITTLREARIIGFPVKLWYWRRSRGPHRYASELEPGTAQTPFSSPRTCTASSTSQQSSLSLGPSALCTRTGRNACKLPPLRTLARRPVDALSVKPFVRATASVEDLRGDSFVILCNDGRRVQVQGRGIGALTALGNEGLKLKSSCEDGNCGTCELGVLERHPDTATMS